MGINVSGCRLRDKRCIWYSCSARCGNGHCIECLKSTGNKNVELCSSLGKSSHVHISYLTHPFPCIRDILWLQHPHLFYWSTRKYTLCCWNYIVSVLYCWRKHWWFFALTSEHLKHTRGSALQDLYTDTTHSLCVLPAGQGDGCTAWLWGCDFSCFWKLLKFDGWFFLQPESPPSHLLLHCNQVCVEIELSGRNAMAALTKCTCICLHETYLAALISDQCCTKSVWLSCGKRVMLISMSTHGCFRKAPRPKTGLQPWSEPAQLTLASACEFRLRDLGSRWLHSFTCICS